jgi:hypothetical protein
MNKEHNPYNIEYTFHIQSAEDFFSQLRAFNKEDLDKENAIDVSDCKEAKEMLQQIGVNCG